MENIQYIYPQYYIKYILNTKKIFFNLLNITSISYY